MKEKITAYLAEHKDEMVEDIFRLVRIRSDRGEPEEGAPFRTRKRSMAAARRTTRGRRSQLSTPCRR